MFCRIEIRKLKLLLYNTSGTEEGLKILGGEGGEKYCGGLNLPPWLVYG